MKQVTVNGRMYNRFELPDLRKIKYMYEVLHYSYAKIAKEIGSKPASVCDVYNHKLRGQKYL